MELMQLEMFVAVLEERSFKRAAEKVYRTQPAVSLGIARLEAEVGTPLIERGRRKEHRLTKAGEFMYEYASRILGLRNDLHSLLGGTKAGGTERFRLGISECGSVTWAARLVEKFQRKVSAVRVEVCYGPSSVLCKEVQDRKLDFAIVPSEPVWANRSMCLMLIPVVSRGSLSCPAGSWWLVQRRVGRAHLGRKLEDEIVSFVQSQTNSPDPWPRNAKTVHQKGDYVLDTDSA